MRICQRPLAARRTTSRTGRFADPCPAMGVALLLLAGLRTTGFGETHPRFPDETAGGAPIPANQARNRRVEITFAKPAG